MLYLESMGFISLNLIFKLMKTELKDVKYISYINKCLWKTLFQDIASLFWKTIFFSYLAQKGLDIRGVEKRVKEQNRGSHGDRYWIFKSYYQDNEIFRVNRKLVKHSKLLLHFSCFDMKTPYSESLYKLVGLGTERLR